MKNIDYENFINFFKQHNLYDEKMFEYIAVNSITFDYKYSDMVNNMGAYYWFKDKKILRGIRLIVPIIDSEKTALINVHKYMYAIMHYNDLNKPCKINIYDEVIPMVFEKLYVLEHPSEELEKYLNNIDEEIRNSTNEEDEKYRIALCLRDSLIEEYQNNRSSLASLNKKAKALAKKKKNS